LEVPNSGLDYTRNLVNSLITNNENDYEKIKIMEQFLKYDKKGYCTYFASALAIMGRISNVPTRYVEGFILPKEVDDEGLYEVTSDDAHAWVEVYIEEVGWMTFEPTPIYKDNNIVKNKNKIIENRVSVINKREILELKNSEISKKELPENNTFDFSLLLILVIITIILFTISFYVYGLRRRNSKFNKSTVNEKVKYKLVCMFKYLKKFGYESNGKLQIEFLEEILLKFEIEISKEEKLIIYKLLYSNILLIDSEYETIYRLYEKFIKKINEKLGKIGRIYYSIKIGG
jgi:predicted site-specific integrase-resolvase